MAEETPTVEAATVPEPVVPETTEEKPIVPETPAKEETPDPADIIRDLPPRKKTAEERIAELTWKRHEAERRAEQAEQRLAEKEKPAPVVSPQAGRPNLQDFDTTESYEDALLDWHTSRSSEQTAQVRQKERETEAVRTFNMKAEKIREIHEDFDEVVQSPVFTKVMRSVLLTSEQGPIMAYYLGRPENSRLAETIASMPPEMQPYEIGKLETKLLLAQKTKKVPGAPVPITPVGGSGNVQGEPDTSKMTDDEWYAYESKQKLSRVKKKIGG